MGEAKTEETIKNMAQLLLGGAKMLQYHCDKCKSPLFEKEGKIICPVDGEFGTEKKAKIEKTRGKPKEKDATLKNILEKKREELVKRLEKEDNPQEISALLDAIAKIDAAAGD